MDLAAWRYLRVTPVCIKDEAPLRFIPVDSRTGQRGLPARVVLLAKAERGWTRSS